MSEKNVTQRLIVIGLVVLVGIIFLRDPRESLRPGLDIAGGTSLIYELDTKGVENDSQLAERVKELLQRRVDPKGVYDLTWRVHGRNRIEVQMPLPSPDARQRLNNYRHALDQLFDPKTPPGQPELIHTITRGMIERALHLPADQQQAEFERLAQRNAQVELDRIDAYKQAQSLSGKEKEDALNALREQIGSAALEAMKTEDLDARQKAIEDSVTHRKDLLEEARVRFKDMEAARQAHEAAQAAKDAAAASQPATAEATTQPATAPASSADVQRLELEYRDARELYEDAVDTVLSTNLNRTRFQEVLELDTSSAVRKNSLNDMESEQPDLVQEIRNVISAHATWRSGRRFLDGPADLKRLLHGSGRLEFRILLQPDPENPTQYDRYRRQLTEEGVSRRPGDPAGWFKVDNPMQFFGFDSQAQMEQFRKDYKANQRFVIERLGDDYYVLGKTTGRLEDGLLHDMPGQRDWQLQQAAASYDEHGRRCVRFRLDPVGGNYFRRLTGANIGNPLCILVDDVAYSAPNIQSAIGRDGTITGEFSADKINYLVRTMEGGTLPARLKDTPLSERTIGSSLGVANRDRAVRAGLIGGAAVILLMLGYYLFVAGSIANVALLLNIFLLLAAMAMLSARITLVGIAGVILAIGMAVDANVLIFERMREEKERGTSLRMVIKNGYDKALSTIFDANITTLLTCVIIYYVGSEEVKGFGLTLGWGIVLNLFTSVFVTRTLFAVLTKYNLIKDVKMNHIIGVPKIDWYSKRKIFIPLSLIVMLVGLGLLVDRGKDAFDVEFRGGIQAEFELANPQIQDDAIRAALTRVGGEITNEGPSLAEAKLEPVSGYPNGYVVSVPGVSSDRLAALITEPLEDKNMLERDGVKTDPEAGTVTIYLAGDTTEAQALATIQGLAQETKDDGDNIQKANVNAVLEVAGVQQDRSIWNVTTTVTNMRLVESALMEAFGDEMVVQPRVNYTFRGQNDRPYPITDRLLEQVVPNLPPGTTHDLTDYLGGVAIFLDKLDPPQSLGVLTQRIDNMHFQPDFQDVPKRKFDLIGVRPSGQNTKEGQPLYRSVVFVAVDPDIRYADDPDRWFNALAAPELRLVTTTLDTQQTLRKVMQFKPQIAARSGRQASTALLLSWAMIIGYLWIRFGRPMYGVAGVLALIHDVLIALAFVGISGWIGGKDHPIGNFFLISDFKINMTIIAALLTIIGYSINDTIVVFDRIRETRGRLGVVTPEIINASINQTLSRTLMTSITTLVVLVIMYIFGGSSIRGFNFCMIVGIITGSYSSIAVASPLLMARFLERRMRSTRAAAQPVRA